MYLTLLFKNIFYNRKMFLLLVAFTMLFSFPASAQVEEGSFEFDGYHRDYKVFLPQNYEANMPVILNLHGYPDHAQWQMDYSLMNEVADTAGFIVVYPESIPPGFHTGLYLPGWTPITEVNDVGFISALIDTLVAVYSVDPARVYACGYSNGGMMSIKLACQLGHRFAAVGSVAGVMLDSIFNESKNQFSIPYLHCHGSADVLIPYNGNHARGIWSVNETFAFFAEKNGCDLDGDTVLLPDLDPTDGTTVRKVSLTDCSSQKCLVLYRVISGGHSWPGCYENITWSSEGNKNYDININYELWDFFRDHENPHVHMAFGQSLVPKSTYIRPDSEDSLQLLASIRNPEEHAVSVWVKIRGLDQDFLDSLQLFDDGLHGDKVAGDSWYGNKKVLEISEESQFSLELCTRDSTESMTQYLLPEPRFTTAGPVILDHYIIASRDTLPNPGDHLKFYITIKNTGETATAARLSVKFKNIDPRITEPQASYSFPDLEPGESAQDDEFFYLDIAEDCETGIELPLGIDIYSGVHKLWSDTLFLAIEEELAVEQIIKPELTLYPNPASESLFLEYPGLEWGNAEIILSDLSGKIILHKISPGTDNGTLELDLTGLSKGLYFLTVRTDKHVLSRKFIKN